MRLFDIETETGKNSFLHTHFILPIDYSHVGSIIHDAGAAKERTVSQLQALSQREQVRVNGHMNTQSQHVSSFLFCVYLTITVSSNTKTETDND